MRTIEILAGVLAIALACENKQAPPSSAAEADGAAKADPAAEAAPEKGQAPTAAAAGPPAEEVLARAVEAAGGAEAMERVKSFYYEAELRIPKQAIEGDVKLWWKEGDFYSEVFLLGMGRTRVGKSGDKIWSDDPIVGLRQLEGREAAQYAWSASLFLVHEWKKHFTSAKTLREHTEGGKTLIDVELSSKDAGTLTISFDKATGLAAQQALVQETPMGQWPIVVTLEDYREVEGLQVPFRQITDAKIQTAEQTIGKLEFGVEVSESRFEMPRTGADVVKPPKEGDPIVPPAGG
jgi:hypothetical protein